VVLSLALFYNSVDTILNYPELINLGRVYGFLGSVFGLLGVTFTIKGK